VGWVLPLLTMFRFLDNVVSVAFIVAAGRINVTACRVGGIANRPAAVKSPVKFEFVG
jgi:hypothetical protein